MTLEVKLSQPSDPATVQWLENRGFRVLQVLAGMFGLILGLIIADGDSKVLFITQVDDNLVYDTDTQQLTVITAAKAQEMLEKDNNG